MIDDLLCVDSLSMGFPLKNTFLPVLDGLSFQVRPAEIFALVGESGCGKSTAAKCIAGMYPSAKGSIRILGQEVLCHHHPKEQKQLYRQVQLIFQDAAAALDPHHTVGWSIGEPLRLLMGVRHPRERSRQVGELLHQVSLSPAIAQSYPSSLSGGQLQRVAIARALAAKPKLLIADEPVASLDVSMQAQIIHLLLRLQQQSRMACLFISHDLNLIRSIAQRVGILYGGTLVELADKNELFAHPLHPYTQALLSATPDLSGSPPLVSAFSQQRGESWREVRPGHYVRI